MPASASPSVWGRFADDVVEQSWARWPKRPHRRRWMYGNVVGLAVGGGLTQSGLTAGPARPRPHPFGGPVPFPWPFGAERTLPLLRNASDPRPRPCGLSTMATMGESLGRAEGRPSVFVPRPSGNSFRCILRRCSSQRRRLRSLAHICLASRRGCSVRRTGRLYRNRCRRSRRRGRRRHRRRRRTLGNA